MLVPDAGASVVRNRVVHDDEIGATDVLPSAVADVVVDVALPDGVGVNDLHSSRATAQEGRRAIPVEFDVDKQ